MASAAVQAPQGHPPAFQGEPGARSTPTSTPTHDVATTLNYYQDPGDGSQPTPIYMWKPETYIRPKLPFNVTITDISGNEDQYTLDKTGFQIYKHESKEKDFLDDEKIKKDYYAETEQLLKDVTGASQVYIFHHATRRNPADQYSQQEDADQAKGEEEFKIVPQVSPVNSVHADQTYTAAENCVITHMGEEAPRLLKGRYQIINVWRPIKPIYRDPLAVADALSVPDFDMVPVGLIYPDREDSTFNVRPNPAHRWYYKYGQQPNEPLLIKCFDSKVDGRARRSPHTAFVNPETENRETRESIEVRALVFHPDDTA